MEGRTGIKDGRWINVVERGIKNDGSYNVGPDLQDIIDEIETDFVSYIFQKVSTYLQVVLKSIKKLYCKVILIYL